MLAQAVLPPPQPSEFDGVVAPALSGSRQSYPAAPRPPDGAPNVLIILLDDVGYAYAESFGGAVPMPTLTELAREGLRYTRFHTTGVCSPTRASLLTGRNHHNVGTAYVMEGGGLGFPGHNTIWPKSAASLAEVLRQHGYNTGAFGKWHNTPIWETSMTGPFERWPTGQGFEYFYGFLGGDTNQWLPALIENTRPIEPAYGNENYHFTVDMTDRAIGWIQAQHSVAPDKPFLLYYAPGATHAPHHVPQQWIERFHGRFDAGWDRYREAAFARQKAMGVIPANTRLTPRPKEIPAWNELSADQKRLAARMMEVYAAFLAHTDHQIGRLVHALQEMSVFENTLILYIVGDNGASGEGGLYGSSVEMKAVSGLPERTEDILPRIDDLGGPNTYPIYPVGWAWAGSTPFQWVKRVASHLGAVRNPMVVSWPKRIREGGQLRTQFHHVVDVVPTVLEAVGIPAPSIVDGVQQQPMDGVSMAYTFDAEGANAAGRHTTQYFEVEANRGIFHDGWFASNRASLPWDFSGRASGLGEVWELYHLEEDFSQANDLAGRMPERLRRMQAMWWAEAGRNHVLPVVPRSERVAATKQLPAPPRKDTNRYVYYPGAVRVPETVAPPVQYRAHTITAYLDPGMAAASGVIAAAGGRFGGFSLYLENGRLAYTYNWFNQERSTILASRPLTAEDSQVRYEFSCDPCRPGGAGTGRLYIGSEPVGELQIPRTVSRAFSLDETFDIGEDTGTAVGLEYSPPFRFTGTLQRVVIEMNSPAAGVQGAPAGRER